jgi:uncharacterized protein (UPF0303 family)
MNQELFVSIMNDVEEYNDYFVRGRMNVTSQFELSCFKVTVVFRYAVTR